MNNKINVLFVCGYGVGSSAISESITNKALSELGVEAELLHTAVGEMSQYREWAKVIVISKKLAEGVNFSDFSNTSIIEVVNIMDGKGIANKIVEILGDNN